MKDLKLTARISDEDLFFKLAHSLGCTLYRFVGDGSVEIVYFSGSKLVYYKGSLSDGHKESLKANGWEVKRIEVNEDEGIVKIEQ